MIGKIIKNSNVVYKGNIFPLLDAEPVDLFVLGSLAFLDAKEITNPYTSSDVFIQNQAESFAKQIPTLTSADSVSLGFTLTGNTGNVVSLELTTKNGLHGIAKKGSIGSNGCKNISLNSALATYINNNVNHKFFVGLSHRITNPVGNGTGNVTYSAATKNDSQCLWAFDARSSVLPPDGNVHNLGSDKIGNDTSTNLVYRAVEVKGIYSTYGEFAPDFDQISIWKVGDTTNFSVFSTGRNPSHIFYTFYIEDLTVSGRSFSEVNAIFKARHNQNHSEGGKYFNDSWKNVE